MGGELSGSFPDGDEAPRTWRHELTDLARRARNAPLRIRALQLANGTASIFLSRPLGFIHVVESPKCGGSWIRNMLCAYNGTERFLDDRLLRPREVIQVHRLYRPWYWRPVVVVRDPRDMYVSAYYHETHYRRREKNLAIERYFRHDPSRPLREDFACYLDAKLRHRTHPPFTYRQFVQSWSNRPRVIRVRYEDFLRDAEGELSRVAQHVGLEVDPRRIQHAVETNRFENATRARGKSRRPGETDPGEFERKGVSGDWRNHFDRRSCELIEKYEHSTLRELGYESDAGWIERFLAAG
jgi:hypothetical protein